MNKLTTVLSGFIFDLISAFIFAFIFAFITVLFLFYRLSVESTTGIVWYCAVLCQIVQTSNPIDNTKLRKI